MITAALCLAFPVLLLIAAWRDLASMLIPNWVSIALACAFFPAAVSAGLSGGEIGVHLAAGAIALLVCAFLFYMNIFGGGDAKVIAAASLWLGMSGADEFVFAMAVAGGGLALTLIALRRMHLATDQPWAARLLSPTEGAPYAVAIAIGGIFAAPTSPVLAAGFRSAGL